MTCPSCNGTGAGPMGAYSPRPPKCLDCGGTGRRLDERDDEEMEDEDNGQPEDMP
jgi:DnaJ-class molecular chaperone